MLLPRHKIYDSSVFDLHPGNEFDLELLTEIRSLAGESRRIGGPDWEWLRTTTPPENYVISRRDNDLVAYGEVAQVGPSTHIDGPFLPDSNQIDASTLDSMLGGVMLRPDSEITWWIESTTSADAQVASDFGLRLDRELIQMRINLPIEIAWGGTWRRFGEADVDNNDWVRVNNRAFASHPDQGSQSLETLQNQMQEPWFDPSGFLLHHIEGELAAFCWTKKHYDLDPLTGEIYVVGVDPKFQGRKIGWGMTVAGLENMSNQGCQQGLLYVESDNQKALDLYNSLGFVEHHRDRKYTNQ